MYSIFSIKRLIITLCLFLCALKINAQKISTKNIEKIAKEYFRAEEYTQALPLYLKLDSLKPDNSHINARLGICYLHSEFRFNALPFLEKAKKSGYSRDHMDFYLGRAYHLGHQFDLAIQNYEQSLKHFNPKKEHDLQKIKAAQRAIEMCQAGKELMKNPIDVNIENIGSVINSPYADYAPVISADETVLIFTSRRPGTTGGQKDETNQYFEDIYMSAKDSNSKWMPPVNMGNTINTGGHDASIGLSADGQELFVYKNDGNGDIYYSILNGNKWSVPKKMPASINNPKSWEPSASITPDERIFFFSSDREGGFGGRDIYVSKKLPNDQWALPMNLGPKINTPYDDDAPFIHPDGKTLYFSSKGHNSIGGFDIFTVQYISKDSIYALTNVGYPINTADDDIFFVWSADGTRAYFSSVRSSDNIGEKDIYVLHRPKPKNVSLIVLKGKMTSKESGQALAATLTVTDNETNQIIGIYNSNSFTGKYTVIIPPGKNYGISVDAEHHLSHSENIDIPYSEEYFEFIKDIAMEPLKAGSLTVLNNVFYNFSKSDLEKESFIELDRIVTMLKENPSLIVEIAGHTDNVGNDNANQELSEHRSESVVKYLVSKGIDSKRLCAKGYGEKFPVASNDTEAGRQQNRRTELIIIESLRKEQRTVGCEGYYYTHPKDSVGKADENFVSLEDTALKRMPFIYFDFNSSRIDKFSGKMLERWILLLKSQSNIGVSIEGHTDNAGSDAYNKMLSEKRVAIVKKLLITRGIKAERIKTIGFGEAHPIESNETDEGRSKNRRVEINILNK
jgi:outer membrane protein OmpA-like peptidoglycan-associated protein/tetratricopeptide (TPR) repeat protein